jgi:fumarylpyruvate hydrolase
MNLAIATWELPTVAIVGTTQRFPVRHIYCVGRNYAEHAKEMGGDASKEPPFFFCKPGDAVLAVDPGQRGRMPYPLATRELHHEIELVAAIGRAGVQRTPENALELVFGYATGLDMTRRDLQNQMREKKRPWDIGKAFAQAAPIASIHPVAAVGHLAKGAIELDVNGRLTQKGDLADMIWDVANTIAFLTTMYELLPGDLIYTGTPSGVGAVVAGDRMDGRIAGLTPLGIDIVAA